MSQSSMNRTGKALRWRTGAIGCLLPIMFGCGLLFAFAAFDPSLADSLAEGRHGGLIRATRAATVSGVNVLLAMVALYLGWEAFRLGWRWADEIAARAAPAGLRLHRTVRWRTRDLLTWSEVSEVSYELRGRAQTLVITLNDGSRILVSGVDNEGGAAEEFAAYARQFVGGA